MFCDKVSFLSKSLSKENIRLPAIGGADYEHVLLGSHAVHFSEDLVDDSVGRSAYVPRASATSLGNRVKFVEEQDARGWRSRLVEHVAYVNVSVHC